MAAETMAGAPVGHAGPDRSGASTRKDSVGRIVAPGVSICRRRELIVLDSRRSSPQLFQASQAFGADIRRTDRAGIGCVALRSCGADVEDSPGVTRNKAS